MATKDFGITENKDLENDRKDVVIEEMKARAATEANKIKNAHAVGDGSYGRSDDSIAETGDDEGKETSADNNY